MFVDESIHLWPPAILVLLCYTETRDYHFLFIIIIINIIIYFIISAASSSSSRERTRWLSFLKDKSVYYLQAKVKEVNSKNSPLLRTPKKSGILVFWGDFQKDWTGDYDKISWNGDRKKVPKKPNRKNTIHPAFKQILWKIFHFYLRINSSW